MKMIDKIEHNRVKYEILRTSEPHRVIQLIQKQLLPNGNTVNIKIIRNVVAEHIIDWIEIYSRFAGVEIRKNYSEYDDSLRFNEFIKNDVIIYAIDFSRYNLLDNNFTEWFTKKILETLKVTESKIIILGRINSLDNSNAFKFKRFLKTFCSNKEISLFIQDLNAKDQDLSKVSKQIILKDKNHLQLQKYNCLLVRN